MNWVPYNEHDELVRAMQQIKELNDCLQNIMREAARNGEDVSYLIAKNALETS